MAIVSGDSKADVIVAGAGPNGLAMALALGGSALNRPLKVLLLDAGDPQARLEGFHDTRGLALTAATQGLFQALGAGSHLAPHLQEMRDIKVTDGTGVLSDRPALLAFTTEPGQRAAAAIAENRHVMTALLEAVQKSSSIALISHAPLSRVMVEQGQVVAETADGKTFRAALIIGADGRKSFVRESAGIAVERKAYGQTALTFSVAHDEPHHGRAEEHFSAEGVFALLPLPGNRTSIVCGTTPERAQRLMALPAGEFEAVLTEEVGSHLGTLKLTGDRQAYPLQMQLAASLIAPRTALIGDAAHVLHPLAGLGLNLGFKDVAALADCIHEAVGRGEDLGSASVLERYAAWRRFDTMMTGAAMDGFNSLFVNGNPALKLVRDAGLKLVDRMPALKALFTKEAAGLAGNLPRLMRGLLP